MAEFGENMSAVGPPVAGCKAASGGTGTSLETHRGEPVSNGSCSVPNAGKKVQNDSSCESPKWESTGPDSAAKPIPRRSSLIKVGHQFHQQKTAHLPYWRGGDANCCNSRKHRKHVSYSATSSAETPRWYCVVVYLSENKSSTEPCADVATYHQRISRQHYSIESSCNLEINCYAALWHILLTSWPCVPNRQQSGPSSHLVCAAGWRHAVH